MPPTFAYGIALGFWIAGAMLVWVASAILFARQRTRSIARSLAFAMASTFPGVFAYQALALIPAGVIMIAAHAFWKLVEPGPSTQTNSPVVIVVSIVAALVAFLFILSLSLLGFFEGWRIGWAVGQGHRVRDEIEATLLMGLVAAVSSKFHFSSGRV
jgi:hypothetical protein